jgi:hypothetical protein
MKKISKYTFEETFYMVQDNDVVYRGKFLIYILYRR